MHTENKSVKLPYNHNSELIQPTTRSWGPEWGPLDLLCLTLMNRKSTWPDFHIFYLLPSERGSDKKPVVYGSLLGFKATPKSIHTQNHTHCGLNGANIMSHNTILQFMGTYNTTLHSVKYLSTDWSWFARKKIYLEILWIDKIYFPLLCLLTN